VRELEQQHRGVVAVEIENATKNQEKITREYGFKTHGLVFLDATGTRVLKTMDGHLMKNEEIERALNEVLRSLQPQGES
jgi:hypothetical protein